MRVHLFATGSSLGNDVTVDLPRGWTILPSSEFPGQPVTVEVLQFAPRGSDRNGAMPCPVICVGLERASDGYITIRSGYTTAGVFDEVLPKRRRTPALVLEQNPTTNGIKVLLL